MSPIVKVVKGKKFNKEEKKFEATNEEIKDGLSDEVFRQAGIGVLALITTDESGCVTRIVVIARKKKT